MNYSIKDIEEKIIAALMPLTQDRGGNVNTLDSYRGQFGGGAGKEDSALLICPAILVRYMGSTYDPDGGSSYERIVRFAIYHASSNLEPGKRKHDVYALLDKSKALLNLNDLGLSITPLAIEREVRLESFENMSVHSAEYLTSFQEEVSS